MPYPDWTRDGTGTSPSNIGGLFTGSAGSYATLPATRTGGGALFAGDVAILTADDGGNLKGSYVWNGTTWVFDYPLTGSTIIPNWASNTVVAANEPRVLRGMIYTSNSARTTGASLNDAEVANWSARFQYSDTRTLDGTGPVNIIVNNAITYLDGSVTAFTADLNRSDGDADGISALIVLTDSTNSITINAGGTITGVVSIPAGTAVGTTYLAVLTDAVAEDWTVQQVGAGGAVVTEDLTVVSQNTINNLANTPASTVDFYINGVLDRSGGITNAGNAVTVTAATLGFNIGLTDAVSAEYST